MGTHTLDLRAAVVAMTASRSTIPPVYRVALVASHVIQYQAPFFRMLAAERELELEVIFCSRDGAEPYLDTEMQTTLRWDLDLLGGYRAHLPPQPRAGGRLHTPDQPRHLPELLFGRYDAAIFFVGWGTITSLLGMAACRMNSTPVLMYGDSSFPPPPAPGAGRLPRAVVGSTDAFLTAARSTPATTATTARTSALLPRSLGDRQPALRSPRAASLPGSARRCAPASACATTSC